MNVTPQVRQITDYSFTLSQDDLVRYLDDPQAWARDVRAQLNGAAPAAGGRQAPKGAAGHASGRRSSKKSTRAKPSKPTLFCPVCELPFKTKGRLERHVKKMHPEYTPAGE